MHETNSQFILLKIPPHLVRLLGKIHALSIEVLFNRGKYPFVLILIPCNKIEHFYSQSRYHKFSNLLIVKQCL